MSERTVLSTCVLEHVRAHVWMCGMRLSRDGGERGGRWGSPLQGVSGRLSHSFHTCDSDITGKPALVSIV